MNLNKITKRSIAIALVGVSMITPVLSTSYANELESNTIGIHNETDNYINYADMISDEDLEKLVNQINEYHKDNPELSFDELNEYFKLLILSNYDESDKYKNINNDYSIETKGAADYLPIVSGKLTAPEKKVFNSNPLKGANVLIFAKQANYHTDNAFKSNYSHTHTNADAFRHTFWNALMAQSHLVGPTYAKQFADAHEQGYPISSNNPKLSRDMDYANNASGRSIGQKSYSGSESVVTNAIRTNVLNALKGGSLKRFVGTDIGKKTVLVKTNSEGLK